MSRGVLAPARAGHTERPKKSARPQLNPRDSRIPAVVRETLTEPGHPLDAPLRQDMEARFGVDFSLVRVHHGPSAELSAAELAAEAYAFGSHIVFGRGRYSPSGAGRQLLAHELAHVAQQNGATRQTPDAAADLHRREEGDAEAAVARVTAGLEVGILRVTPAAYIACKPAKLATVDEELLELLKARPKGSDPAVVGAWKSRLTDFVADVPAAKSTALANRLAEKSSDAIARYFRAQVPDPDFRAELIRQLMQNAGKPAPGARPSDITGGVSLVVTPSKRPKTGSADPALALVRKGRFFEVFKDLNAMWMKAMLERLGGFENTDLEALAVHLDAADPLGQRSKWRLAAAAGAAHMRRNGVTVEKLESLDDAMDKAQLPQDQRAEIRAILPPLPGGAATRVHAAFDLPRQFGGGGEGAKVLEASATAKAFRILNVLPARELQRTLALLDKSQLRALMMSSRQAEKYGELKAEELRQALYAAWVTRYPTEPAKFDLGGEENPVLRMSAGAKITEAITRSLPKLPAETRERFKELLTPESIAMMAGFAAAYVASQVTPVGWVADIIVGGMLAVTVLMVGQEAIELVKLLMRFSAKATGATSTRELDEAAELFAQAASKVSVDILMAILFHKAGKSANLKPPRPRSPGIIDYLTPEGKPGTTKPLGGVETVDLVTPSGQVIRIPLGEVPSNVMMAAELPKSAGPTPSAGGKAPPKGGTSGKAAPSKTELPGKKLAAAEAVAKKKPPSPKELVEQARSLAEEGKAAQERPARKAPTQSAQEAAAARAGTKKQLAYQLRRQEELVNQMYKEINELEQRGKQRLSDEQRQAIKDEKAELARQTNELLESQEKLRVQLAELEVSPLARARTYSYSGSAARAVMSRARGLDEISRQPIQKPSIDHVVPVEEIVRMDRWNDLSRADQQAVLSRVDNLQLMEQPLNSSKGARRWVNWPEGRRHYGNEAWQKMVEVEGRLRTLIQEDILARAAGRFR